MAISQDCQKEHIAAYIDGELDAPSLTAFEQHVNECRPCARELNAQRLFICELDATLAPNAALPMPKNFAQIVAAHAESDMRGVRNGVEHKRALRFCMILALASFALLGVAASKSVFLKGELLVSKVLNIFALFWKALNDAAAGLAVISRVISQALLPQSLLAGLLTLSLLVLAIVLLSLLISSYHRYNRMRLLE